MSYTLRIVWNIVKFHWHLYSPAIAAESEWRVEEGGAGQGNTFLKLVCWKWVAALSSLHQPPGSISPAHAAKGDHGRNSTLDIRAENEPWKLWWSNFKLREGSFPALAFTEARVVWMYWCVSVSVLSVSELTDHTLHWLYLIDWSAPSPHRSNSIKSFQHRGRSSTERGIIIQTQANKHRHNTLHTSRNTSHCTCNTSLHGRLFSSS